MYSIAEWINTNVKRLKQFDYSFYAYIDNWMDWYAGELAEFHNYKYFNGIETIELQRAKLHMGKQVCSDVSSMTFNENVIINMDDEQANKFIQGYDQSGGIFGENNFWENAAYLYEGSVCALGTGAFEVYLDDMPIIEGTTTFIPSTDTKIKIGFIRADHILPISFENKIITEVCFVNELRINNEDYADLRLHIKKDDGTYIIYNKRLKKDKSGWVYDYSLADNRVSSFETGTSIPFFGIMRTAFNNNFDKIGNNPMGISIYANAIDVLKGCDITYDTLMNEMRLGQKMIFMNKSMLDMDNNGKIRNPIDDRRQLFQYVGDEALANEQNWIHEFNPDIRVDVLTKALEKQLNYLSAKVGLGDHFYKFNDGNVEKTATEVLAENSTAFRTVRRAQISVEKALLNLCRAILYCGKTFLGLEDLDVDTNISVQFDASIIENKETVRNRDMQEVQLGIMSKEEYRSKYHAESLEEASNKIREIENYTLGNSESNDSRIGY
jgi:A118 family predicted phage portal protein